jgi:hypothetical protein
MRRGIAALAACVGLLTALMSSAAVANEGGSGVVSPEDRIAGRTYGQWSAAWWKWSLQAPNVPSNPNADQNAGTLDSPEVVDCAAGQSGPVWFLAGTTAIEPYSTAYRTCSIPAGKFLFFPVVDGWNDNLNCPHMPQGSFSADELANNVKVQTDQIKPGSMKVTIDDGAVAGLYDSSTDFRASAGGFYYTLPADNWLSAPFCPDDPFPAGTRPPKPGAFADGVYIMLAPLSIGTHHLHWEGAEGAGPISGAFSQNLSYTIVVTPSGGD